MHNPEAPFAEERLPTSTPIRAYGNNVVVACPCGRIVIARSLGEPGNSAFECGCGRWFKGFPDGGGRIDRVLVWEKGTDTVTATYAVAVAEALHQAR